MVNYSDYAIQIRSPELIYLITVSSCSLSNISSLLSSPTILLFSCMSSCCQTVLISENIKYLSFCVDLFHLNQHSQGQIMLSKSFSFSWQNNIPLHVNTHTHTHTHILPHFFILLIINVHFGYFHVLAITYNTTMNMQMKISFKTVISFFFSKHKLKSRITASYGSSIFNFLKNLHPFFHSGCTI